MIILVVPDPFFISSHFNRHHLLYLHQHHSFLTQTRNLGYLLLSVRFIFTTLPQLILSMFRLRIYLTFHFIIHKFKGFVLENPETISSISNSIIDPLHPVPEHPYNIYSDIFDCWFGIPFKDTNCFTRVRSPHPTEILSLYGLPNLIPLYTSNLSANQIRTLVLHTLTTTVSNHIVTTFLSDVVPPAIPPPSSIQ